MMRSGRSLVPMLMIATAMEIAACEKKDIVPSEETSPALLIVGTQSFSIPQNMLLFDEQRGGGEEDYAIVLRLEYPQLSGYRNGFYAQWYCGDDGDTKRPTCGPRILDVDVYGYDAQVMGFRREFTVKRQLGDIIALADVSLASHERHYVAKEDLPTFTRATSTLVLKGIAAAECEALSDFLPSMKPDLRRCVTWASPSCCGDVSIRIDFSADALPKLREIRHDVRTLVEAWMVP